MKIPFYVILSLLLIQVTLQQSDRDCNGTAPNGDCTGCNPGYFVGYSSFGSPTDMKKICLMCQCGTNPSENC